MPRAKALVFIQGQRLALLIGVAVQQSKNCGNSGKSQAINDHKRRNLGELKGLFHRMRGQNPTRESRNHYAEQKLERIHKKQNHKYQNGVQKHSVESLQTVAARKDVVLVPYLDQDGETDGEGDKPFHSADK